MKLYRYYSNNSGGSWWLQDKDWYALEKAGWDVKWVNNDPHAKRFLKDGRFLGALATQATKSFLSKADAIEEFEAITGQDYNEEGCPCCGSPHGIYEE